MTSRTGGRCAACYARVAWMLVSLSACAWGDGLKNALACYDFAQPDVRYQYARSLREPSGLAYAHEGAVLTHDDNVSTLYLMRHMDPAPPQLWNSQLPVVKGDFEGVAVLDGYVYLLASSGVLFRTHLEQHAGGARLQRVTTGIEGRCNFEGLAARPGSGELILACKYINEPPHPSRDEVHLYRFDAQSLRADPQAIVVDVSAVRKSHRLRRLRPSGIEWLPTRQRYMLLAGKERLLLELDSAFSVVGAMRLPRKFHRQAEGLTLDARDRLIITDEAHGRAATLSVYSPGGQCSTVAPRGMPRWPSTRN